MNSITYKPIPKLKKSKYRSIEDVKKELKVTKRLLITVDIVIILFMIFLTITIYIPEAVYMNHEYKISAYYGMSEYLEEDQTVVAIAEICSNFEIPSEQIVCVHEIATINFEYSHNTKNVFENPTNTLVNGGVCRDWSIFFKAIYDLMGYETDYNFDTPQHVFINIYEADNVWTIDQEYLIKK